MLLTDGEDNDSEPLEAADEASKLGVKIFTVGVGSRSGELIPEYDQQGKVTGYIKDADGKYVTSRLGEQTLVEIARRTGGEVFYADSKRFGVEDVAHALVGAEAHRERRPAGHAVRRGLPAAAAGDPARAVRRGRNRRAPAARRAGT